MGGDWPVGRLGDFADVQTGPFGSQLHKKDYVAIGTPIITVEHLGENRIIHSSLPCVSDQDRLRLKKYSMKQGDIIFSRVGSVDRRAYVSENENGWLFSGRCLRVRANSDELDSRYLSYFFGLEATKEHIRQIAVGATMPSLNTKILSNLKIVIPPIFEQKRIAVVLGALDDKIELNRKMNRTLEAMAQAIFKSWFVDFEPFRDGGMVDSELGPIPKGWEVGQVSVFALLQTDSIHPGKKPEALWEHYSIPAFDEGQNAAIDEGASIKSGKYRVPVAAILVSKLNPRFPRVWMPSVEDAEQAICSTEFMPFVPNGDYRSFVYDFFCSLPAQAAIQGRTTGTTGSRQRVRPKDIESMPAIIPPMSMFLRYEGVAGSMHKRRLANLKESLTLAELRDTLLSKLISGEIRVPDVNHLVGETA